VNVMSRTVILWTGNYIERALKHANVRNNLTQPGCIFGAFFNGPIDKQPQPAYIV